MATQQEFYYNAQIRRWLVQFMAIFAGMKVQVGWNEDKEPRLAPIPVVNGSKDRVVAAIKGENTQNKPLRLPIFSASILNVDQYPEGRKGVGLTRRQTINPIGGEFPTDLKVVEQRMPVPYMMEVELGIWTSNQDQHYQVLEQIFMIFDPDLQLQHGDDVMDWTRMSRVELTSVQFEEAIPSGTDRRIIQTFLRFKLPIWISVPAEVHTRFIQDIFIRLGAVNAVLDNSFDIIADLDSQGIQYDHITAEGIEI